MNESNLKIQLRQVNRRGKNRKARKQPEPTAIAREYRAYINQVIEQYADLTEAILFPILEQAAQAARLQGVRADSWVDDLDSGLDSLLVRAMGMESGIGTAVGGFAQQLGQFNQRGFQSTVNATLGVNVELNEPWLADELKAWATQNVRLVSSVPQQEHTQISRIALEGVRSGKPVREIQAEIRERHNISRHRAQTIARTETAKLNSELTERRQREIGISTYYWRAGRDERVRASHGVLDGMLCSWDDPTVYSDDGGVTWKQRSSIGGYEGAPGTDFNCFPGSVELDGFPSLDKLYRRFHAGELTEIVLDNGTVLPVTANHPILTTDGIIKAESLGAGQYIIGAINNSFSAVDVNIKRFNTTFEQVFCALINQGVPAAKSAVKSGQFHGDSIDEEVEVIHIDSFLRNMWDTSLRQKLLKLGFTDADMPVLSVGFSGCSDFSTMLKRMGLSDRSFMSRFNLLCALMLRHLTPLERFCLGLRADMNAGIGEVASDNASRHAEVFSNRVFAAALLVHGDDFMRWKMDSITRESLPFLGSYASSLEVLSDAVGCDPEFSADLAHVKPFEVKLNRIIDKRVVKFSGHVYNLQSVSGYYSTYSLYVSNCRCAAEANTEQLLERLGI